jgi:uncharacterized delta-60 repeat protein
MNPIKPCPKALLIALILLTFQSKGEIVVDDSFKASLTSGGTVNSVLVDQNGTVLIGGAFSKVNDVSRQNLARLLANGAVDTSFNASANGYVRTMQLNSAGEIMVGGSFAGINGENRPNIARLLTGGGLDTTFEVATGVGGGIHSISVGNHENVVIGGGFTTINAGACVYVASLDGLGTLENQFKSAISSCEAMETGVYVVATQNDGKILAGGNFNINGHFETLTRLNADGTVDGDFAGDHGPILYPRVIIPLNNGQIIVAGSANPFGEGFVRRLNENGSVDNSFQAPTFFGSVNSVLPLEDGRMIIGGSYTQVAGESWRGVVRLNSNGSLDGSFMVATDNAVTSLAVQNDGKIIVGGAFNTIGGVAQNGIARLKENSITFHSSSNTEGHFMSQLKVDAGRTYVIESSADLKGWSTFTTNTATQGVLTIVDNAAPTQKRRFFRARMQE